MKGRSQGGRKGVFSGLRRGPAANCKQSINAQRARNLQVGANGPDTDDRVGVAGEKGGAIEGPGEGGAGGSAGLGLELRVVLSEVGNEGLSLEVEDLDASVSTGAKPVVVGGEAEGVDDGASLQAVQFLAFVQVPEDGMTVLATRGTEGTVGGNSDGIDVASVASQSELDGAGSQVPDLDELIPTTRDHDGVSGAGREAHAADPVRVSVFDHETADTKGVPEADGTITRTRDDLTVVSREGNREDILGVANEATGGGASGQIPEAEGGIPGGREGELTISRDYNILNVVTVATEGTLGEAKLGFIAGQGPDDDALVARGGQDGLVALRRGSNGGNPAVVASKLAAQSQGLSGHCFDSVDLLHAFPIQPFCQSLRLH